MIRSKVKGHSNGVIIESILVVGIMVNSMELACMLQLMAPLERENGKWAREKSGLGIMVAVIMEEETLTIRMIIWIENFMTRYE